jgi:hypothetical protein
VGRLATMSFSPYVACGVSGGGGLPRVWVLG